MGEYIIQIGLWDNTTYEFYLSRKLYSEEIEDVKNIIKKYKYSNYNNENNEMYNEIEDRLDAIITNPDSECYYFMQDF